MNRGEDGRFTKADKKLNEENFISLQIPSVKSLLTFIIGIFILFPWFIIIYRNDVFAIIVRFFDGMISGKVGNIILNGETKVNGEEKSYWK